MPPHIEPVERLDAAAQEQIRQLVARAEAVDGVPALSEHAMLRLAHEHPDVGHLLAVDGPSVVGYAQVEIGDAGHPAVAELVMDPHARGRGLGRRLAAAVLGAVPAARLHVWAHGDHPAARRLAEDFGMSPVRTLWQLRHGLTEPLPPAVMPDGVTLRTFRPGLDDDAWVELNARAFATHPEQGGWTAADLHDRMAESWFDPAGFFLAERQDPARLVGFHWTKVHPGSGEVPAVGEVYVLGVDPGEQGNGLGRALTLAGLGHLRRLGLAEVMLYVDDDNAAGMRLYAGLGFHRHRADIMYATSRAAGG